MISSNEKSELMRFIEQAIDRRMNILLNGQTKSAKANTESIDNLYPSMPTVPDRPLVEPYGFHSQAPDGTLNFSARVGSHVGNRYVIGHRDAARPALATGESVLYSFAGYRVRCFANRIAIAKGDDYETAVVGETLVAFLTALIGDLVTHTHASPGAPPTNAAAFTALKTGNLDNGKILAKDGGRYT